MSIFARAVARIVVSGSLAAAGIGPAQAAGALAVGTCGAYGFAYDYQQAEAARSAALDKCKGSTCKIVTAMRGSCAAFAIDGRNACGPLVYASATRLGQAQNAH